MSLVSIRDASMLPILNLLFNRLARQLRCDKTMKEQIDKFSAEPTGYYKIGREGIYLIESQYCFGS